MSNWILIPSAVLLAWLAVFVFVLSLCRAATNEPRLAEVARSGSRPRQIVSDGLARIYRFDPSRRTARTYGLPASDNPRQKPPFAA